MSRLAIRTTIAAIVLATLFPASGAHGETPDPEQRFREANAAFAAGDYDAAVAAFRSILDTGRFSTALLYDLANAEARAGNIGEAILQYERARLLAPRDPDVLANAAQVRAEAGLSEPHRDRLQDIATWLTVDGWAWLAAGGLWCACALVIARALGRGVAVRSGRRLASAVAVLLAAAAVAAALGWTRWSEIERAVIVGPPGALRVAPFPSANPSTEITAGQIVGVTRVHGDFALLRTEDGQAGWLPRDQVRPILPP